jgi:tryptophan synthase beta subunit
VKEGTRTLKDAISQALREWAANLDDTHYILGTACGPHPFPAMVCYFQSIIGKEAHRQILEREDRVPLRLYACVGGGQMPWGFSAASLPIRSSGLRPEAKDWKRDIVQQGLHQGAGVWV